MTMSATWPTARPENYDVVMANLVESARGDWAGHADDSVADAGDWASNRPIIPRRGG